MTANSSTPHPHLNQSELADIRQQMLRFAQNQLADTSLAEDAVQDTLIKTLTHHDSFKGRSAYKSWVFAILKNTITDMLRKRGREVSASVLADDDEQTSALFDTLFQDNRHWHKVQRPAKWDTPDEVIENDGFWEIMESCLHNLPAEQARIFMMREYIGLDTDEVCQECDISSSKFYVTMHRARLKLQTCLSINWFDNAQPSRETHA